MEDNDESIIGNGEDLFSDVAPMRLCAIVNYKEGPEEVVFWEGTTTDWMLDGPAICETLAIAVKMTQDKLRKELNDQDNPQE